MGFFGRIGETAKGWFGFIESAVVKGIGAVRAFSSFQVVDVGIDEAEFSAAYTTRERAGEIWNQITRIPSTYLVSERFGVVSPFDWSKKHVMKMKIEFTDLNTKERGVQWITVESDTELSKAEWEAMAQTGVLDSPAGYNYWIEGISDYQYYLRE
jgi:hypothetical protein